MHTGKFFLVFASLVFITVAVDLILDHCHYKESEHHRLQKEIDKKFARVDDIYNQLKTSNWHISPISENEGIVMLVYKNDSLVYWSDNSLAFNYFSNIKEPPKRFDFISNGWYIIKPYLSDSIRAYGLILIKTQFPYENNFLVNQFHKDLKLPEGAELLTALETGSFSIIDWEGIYLFSVRFEINELRFSKLEKYLIPVFHLIWFISLLFLIHRLISETTHFRKRNYRLLLLPLLFVLLRFLQYKFKIPHDVYELEMFGPIPFAKSSWLPSLGDLLINTLLILFIIEEFYANFRIPAGFFKRGSASGMITLSLLILILTLFYFYTHLILTNLILHSVINFEFYKAASLNVYTLVGLLIMVMHFAAFLLLANRILSVCVSRCGFSKLMVLFIIISIVSGIIYYILTGHSDIISFLFYLLIFLTLSILQYRNIPLGTYTSMSLMVVVFSAFSVYIITHNEAVKTANNMKVVAENLAIQHDPVAEYLLEDISEKLIKDRTLEGYMFNLNISVEAIHNYLQSNYFNGFWGKYKLWHKDCNPSTEEYFDNDTLTSCYKYYENLMAKGSSVEIPGTRFHFLDLQDGRIHYLGWIPYKRRGRPEISLFIELESRLITEELGFPDLLLDKKFQKNNLLEEYSYAKYFKNQLLSQSGEFQYSLDLRTYKDKPLIADGYRHYFYNVNEDNIIMVSKRTTHFFDKMVSFSYIFIFYYIIALTFIIIRDFSKWGPDIEFNFKNKIQFSITGIILFSLFLVGGGSIYFSIEQYQRKQHDILSEKIQSVYMELDHLLAYFPSRIPPDWKNENYDNLNQLLIKFSDVFYSDINLYDPRGELMATSRAGIFSEGILGEKMNPVAFEKMVVEKKAEFINRERIGSMEYISAYVPFVNTDNKLLAYLNLPYFTRQNVLQGDVSTLVVAIINVYVLLILVAIAMSTLISNQITRPLRLIQHRFSQIKIGKKNEEIVYYGHDEIAGLVNEYNRMVKELTRNVEMLAKSERESAWREMAKQVAHEIKNPLTPMKLSVQHLLRSWNDNRENFGEYLARVAQTLIQQIDTLSFIASEFSNFAKMPKAVNEKINLVEEVKSILTLFANTENVDFALEYESDLIIIYADKEQLSRIFINLIKNAIQSIPDNRKGKVAISIVVMGEVVNIQVSDNGKGIPEELHGKLFTPSFTTKSSGMGLGLSIVKSLIESFGGNITFNTKVNQGTTFIIELPVFLSDERFEAVR